MKNDTEYPTQTGEKTKVRTRDDPRIVKAFNEDRRDCPKDRTAIRWKEGVGAFVCARSHIVGIRIRRDHKPSHKHHRRRTGDE